MSVLRRFGTWLLATFVVLAASVSLDVAAPPSEEMVMGRGWSRFFAGVGCMGCAVGAVGIAMGGWGVVVGALANPKSVVVVGACVGTCGYAIGLDEVLSQA